MTVEVLTMNLATVRTLFDYSAWATDRILARVEQLTPAQFTTAPSDTLPSVRQMLAHMLGAETLWLTRLRTGESAIRVEAADFPDPAALRRAFAEQRAAIGAFLDTLSDERLAQPVRFERRGATLELLLWQVLFQLVNHGTQHRSEVAAILTEYGHSPGDLDFLFYAMQAGRPTTTA